jgi:hypothetical protein
MALKECSMSRQTYKAYTRELRLEAIRLAGEVDKPVTQVAMGSGCGSIRYINGGNN